MLKTIEAVIAMLREQGLVLSNERENHRARTMAMIATLQEEEMAFSAQLGIMQENVALAIRKLEGEEVANG